MTQEYVQHRRRSSRSRKLSVPSGKHGGAWGTSSDRNLVEEQQNPAVSPVLLRRKSLSDFEVFAKNVSERIHGDKRRQQFPIEEITHATTPKQRVNDHTKVLPDSQPVTPLGQSTNHQEPSPVAFLMDENPCETRNEEHTLSYDIAELSFIEPEIVADLPSFASIDVYPNTSYNNIEGKSFVNFIDDIYKEIVTWKKNLFQVPTGKCGKAFIKLTTEWINHFNLGSTFQGIALKVVMVLPALLLQKPSSKSKAKDHSKMLEERLKSWNEGKMVDLLKEGKVIQKKLKSGKRRNDNDIPRIFSKLMFEGKVHAALRFLDENTENAVLPSNDEVITKLKELHPTPAPIRPDTLIQGPLQEVNPAHFHRIDEQQILKAASRTKGSGGPSQLDASQWRRLLCSNQYKTEGKELRESIATFAKKISLETLDPSTLCPYTASRLIPLNKTPGETDFQVRPIGVGEVLRRIVGKTITWSLRTELQEAAGPLQVSSGLNAGAEAAIHAMKLVFENDSTDGVILVDAENAFNRLNRMVALHNIRYLCPPLATVLINTYRKPTRLFISGGGEISSQEGTTQGDTLAMPFYAISTTPLLHRLRIEMPETCQVWFADDATGGGELSNLQIWWRRLIFEGKKYGYHVKPTKSWLILKDSTRLQEAEKLFEGSPINITTQGKKHLGAVIGTADFKTEFIEKKVNEWCKELTTLADIATTQPHAAYAAFIHGEQHKFTYFLRTINGISEFLEPLDEIINDKFIPALFGCGVTNEEREVLSLPIRDGGLGLSPVSSRADQAYEASKKITAPLTEKIIQQAESIPDEVTVNQVKAETMAEVSKRETARKENITSRQSTVSRRSIEQTAEPGASSWLGALPLKSQNFNLNKAEFHDALCLRYDKKLKNLPSKCACGSTFDTTHAMNCHRGGFINSRHDNIRNFNGRLLQNVCRDVEIEPGLQNVSGGTYGRSANTADEARLDIRARGFWRPGQNAYFDIRVTNADCESQKTKPIKSVLRKHEMEKKRQYNTRIMEVEHGSFTPLVLTVKGVMGHECNTYIKALAEKLANKKGEKYDEIIRYIRVKLSFLVLKASLVCLRGSRSLNHQIDDADDFTFNLCELNV